MYLQYRDLKLIEQSGRPDTDNEAILRGDYLDKTPQTTEDNQEIPFVMPSRDEMMKYIFSDWQVGDILVIADIPLRHPKLQGDTLVEMTREEVCKSGDLTILVDGEVFENGIVKTIPRPQGFRIEWEYPNWVEKATKNEQLEYLKQEILKNTRELLVYKEVGFSNDELQNKIDALVEKHRILSEDIAREDNKLY